MPSEILKDKMIFDLNQKESIFKGSEELSAVLEFLFEQEFDDYERLELLESNINNNTVIYRFVNSEGLVILLEIDFSNGLNVNVRKYDYENNFIDEEQFFFDKDCKDAQYRIIFDGKLFVCSNIPETSKDKVFSTIKLEVYSKDSFELMQELNLNPLKDNIALIADRIEYIRIMDDILVKRLNSIYEKVVEFAYSKKH